MKVAVLARHDLIELPAGDTVQVVKTQRALGRRGILAVVSTDPNPVLAGCDVAHIFGLARAAHAYRQYSLASKASLPVVVSPILWDVKEFLSHEEPQHVRKLLSWWERDNALRGEVLGGAAAILPNSWAEADFILRTFNPPGTIRVVPNAAEAGHDEEGRPRHRVSGILCVARVSPRKNQLGLIKALSGTGVSVTLAGGINDPFYFRDCTRHATENFQFVGQVPHEGVWALYSRFRVHVMPSWFETPGLSSLEAGLAGCVVVTTDRGATREYFRDLAIYCDPSSIDSIREACLKGLDSDPNPALAGLIAARYTWEEAARITAEAYGHILKTPVPPFADRTAATGRLDTRLPRQE